MYLGRPMTKLFSKISLLVALTLVCNLSFAQDGSDQFIEDSKNDLLLVVGAGLGGAILGLSTLSFVEEPKDHTNNITIGASIGIIAGVIIVAMSQADKSRDSFVTNFDSKHDSGEFSTTRRFSWHNRNIVNNSSKTEIPAFAMSFSY